MKKWVFLLILILSINFAGVHIAPAFHDKVEIQNGTDRKEETGSVLRKKIEKGQVYKGDLLLVNNDYPIHREGMKADVVKLFTHKELTNGYGLLNNEIYLSKDIVHKFSVMVAAAEKDGVQHFLINSGFRDLDEQSVLYQEMGSDYALPAGYSEHNLGLSLDVGSTQITMEKSPEGKWIKQNAWKYGFILRYPKDKTNITGILYEPWHIRYVGLPHSAIMQEKNLALEEYLDYLKEERNISVSVNGEKYIVSYYPIFKGLTITVPKNNDYEISGDNMDGVIITVHE